MLKRLFVVHSELFIPDFIEIKRQSEVTVQNSVRKHSYADAIADTTSLPRWCRHIAYPGMWDVLEDPDKMVQYGTANTVVLTFNRLWTIWRELATTNILFGQNNSSAGPWGLCYSVKIKCNIVITEIILVWRKKTTLNWIHKRLPLPLHPVLR